MRAGFHLRDLVLACIDGVLAAASIVLAFVLRFDPLPAFQAFSQQIGAIACFATFLKPSVFFAAGLYSVYWGYVSRREVLQLLAGASVASIALAAAVALLQSPVVWLRGIPPSVFFIDFLVTTAAVSFLRVLAHTSLSEASQPRGRS